MVNTETLRRELTEYDGRNPTILAEMSRRHHDHAAFLSELVSLASDAETVVSEGATWIIKAQLEEGNTLSPQDVQRLVSRLDDVTAWQAQLHICQSLRYIAVPENAAGALEAWLKKIVNAPRPFLRAWALDALCGVLGAGSRTQALLDQMESDEAASVRARVRNLRRAFGNG